MYYTNPDIKFLLKNQALLFVQITCIHNIYNNTSVISEMANRIWRWEVFLPSLIRILKNRQKWQNGHFRRIRMYKGKEVWEYKTITIPALEAEAGESLWGSRPAWSTQWVQNSQGYRDPLSKPKNRPLHTKQPPNKQEDEEMVRLVGIYISKNLNTSYYKT